MASTIAQQLKGLVLNAQEVRTLTGWHPAMIEDYLTVLENLVAIAVALDSEIDKKIEETATDFLDGSVPYANSNLLASDVTNFFYTALTKILYAKGFKSETIDLVVTPAVTPSSQEGRITWNDTENTINIDTGLGPILQVGYEDYILVYNNTLVDFTNGQVIYPVGDVGGIASVELANASTHVKIQSDVAVLTMAVPSKTLGIATIRGRVRDFDTSHLVAGAPVYVGLTDGTLTATKPTFPNYPILIGGCAVSDPLVGVLNVQKLGSYLDTTNNFWNGVFRETFDFRVTSNGTTITGTLTPQNGHDDMTMIFSDGFTLIDTNPGATITLTEGTATVPQTNYIYIPWSTKVLTKSLSGWPTTEHIKVAQVLVQTAVIVESDGALRNQNWNDAVQSTSTNQGHLSHIGEKIRQFEAQWDTGCEGSAVIDTTPSPDSVIVKTTSGYVYQMHRQIWPVKDMTQYTIDGVNQGLKTFTISDDGDLSSTYYAGNRIQVNGSTGNDGLYTIVSTAYSAPDFVVTVEEVIPDATVDGTIGDDIIIVNDSATPYKTLLDLNGITLDANGVSIQNRAFSVVVWGTQNKTGEPQHLMLNLPGGSYNRLSPDQAVNDINNYAVYTIPKSFQGVGFLIARFTFQVTAGGTGWTLYNTEDLRGKIPNSTAGGGAGGSGVTTFLGLTDTPSSYTGEASNLPAVNAGETALEFKTVGIADDNILEVDGTPADDDFAKFTPNGLEGRSYAEVKSDLDLEIGVDVLAQQTIGIANDNLLEVDGTPNSAEYAKFTANGLEGKTFAEVLADLSAQAGASFNWNAQVVMNLVQLIIGATSITTGLGALAVFGTTANSAGPHAIFTGSTDAYPMAQLTHWNHDIINWALDAYYDGTDWRSSDGSNFRLRKRTDSILLQWDSGVAQGDVVTFNTAFTMDLTTGKITIAEDLTLVENLIMATGKSATIETIKAVDSSGLALQDDGGQGPLVNDGGMVTNAYQTAFLVQPSAAQNNIAVGSDVTVLWGTEIKDIGGNFASNTFTAPKTGMYQLSLLLQLNTVQTTTTILEVTIRTSNRDYSLKYDPQDYMNANARFPVAMSILADMEASDTAYVIVNLTGGSAVTDVTTDSRFSGFLVG